ncbi:MAG: hypothetical protein IH590_13390 [Aquamicrobium sp.]|nr:hypothetical protein [Aquamicrobium sp.]
MRKLTVLLLLAFALAGCASEDVLRYDGVTTAAGDAVAANTVLQMADPWPRGVENRRLRTPAVRPAAAAAAPAKEPAK